MTPDGPTGPVQATDPGAGPGAGDGTATPPPSAPSRAPLTAEQRAAAFSTGSAVDRNAALRAGRTPVPRRIIVAIVIAGAVIGLGGVALEHFYGNVGAVSSVANTTLSTTGEPPAPPTPVPPSAPPLGAPLDAFLGLKQLGTAPAPGFQLQEPSGATWTLSGQTGKVVVLTFYNTGCNDICPVLGLELKEAAAELGTRAGDVEFAVVNTDPDNTAVNPTPDALAIPGLGSTPGVHFLTGTLRQLNTVWIDYGVTVTVGNTASQMTHNNILYFIDPQGRLRSLALPFADEDARGDYRLPAADTQRFAEGIARTATSLTPNP